MYDATLVYMALAPSRGRLELLSTRSDTLSQLNVQTSAAATQQAHIT